MYINIFKHIDMLNLIDALAFMIFLPFFLFIVRSYFMDFNHSYKNYFFRNGIPWFCTYLVREYVKSYLLYYS